MRLNLPFPLPDKKKARESAGPGYWRAADERVRELMADPEVRKGLAALGVLKPQSSRKSPNKRKKR